jgi:histidinol phosphatase-like enzyme
LNIAEACVTDVALPVVAGEGANDVSACRTPASRSSTRPRAAVTEAGGRIDAIFHCLPGVGCPCRKPEVGMFERAAGDLGLRFYDGAVLGDRPSDMLAANRIGAIRVLVGER